MTCATRFHYGAVREYLDYALCVSTVIYSSEVTPTLVRRRHAHNRPALMQLAQNNKMAAHMH